MPGAGGDEPSVAVAAKKKGGGGIFPHWWPSAALPPDRPGGYKCTPLATLTSIGAAHTSPNDNMPAMR